MSRSIRIKGPRSLSGVVALPGDKSISHRVALIASVARGTSLIKGFATSADCRATLGCIQQLGIRVDLSGDRVVIYGRGLSGYAPAGHPPRLNAGNSGSTIRMLTGLLAAQPFTSEIDGDESLRRRPMARVIEPLSQMGARIAARDGHLAPLLISGSRLKALDYKSRIASAQVKSCVLLAGLYAEGKTAYSEPFPTRNHTELMLAEFGAQVETVQDQFRETITVEGGHELIAREYEVPGDISSAAFFIAAAAALADSQLIVRNVGLNPSRTAFLDVLKRLGAVISKENVKQRHGEASGDLRVASRPLKVEGGELVLRGEIIPNIIDEIPILAALGTQVEGRLTVREAGELRVKESDRIRTLVDAVRALGGEIEEYEDGFTVSGPQRLRGGRVETVGDHRIAMAFSIAALMAEGVTEITEADSAGVSFPEFYSLLDMLAKPGGVIEA